MSAAYTTTTILASPGHSPLSGAPVQWDAYHIHQFSLARVCITETRTKAEAGNVSMSEQLQSLPAPA